MADPLSETLEIFIYSGDNLIELSIKCGKEGMSAHLTAAQARDLSDGLKQAAVMTALRDQLGGHCPDVG